MRDWTGQINHLDDASGNPTSFTAQLTAISLHFSGFGCQYDMTGSALASTATIAPHGTLVNISSLTFPSPLATNPLSLTLSNVTGTCALFGIANGSNASFSMLFVFAPVINLAAI